MSNAASRLSYMKLEDSKRTFFHIGNRKYTVKNAPITVFDGFISQVVEEIVKVNRSQWPIFQRWRIINACLPEEVLILEEVEGGSLLLKLPEEKSSTSEVPAEENPSRSRGDIPELLTSGSGNRKVEAD